MKTERIIFVPGIKTWNFYIKGWKKDLKKIFPEQEIIFLNDIFYFHWEKNKTKKIVDKGTKILQTPKKTIILAHSFGGILATKMISNLEDTSFIEKFITMATPHQMKIFGVKKAKESLKWTENINTNLYTFGGYLDPVVPYFWTQSKNSKSHKNLWCEHLGFLLFPWVRKEICNYLGLYKK